MVILFSYVDARYDSRTSVEVNHLSFPAEENGQYVIHKKVGRGLRVFSRMLFLCNLYIYLSYFGGDRTLTKKSNMLSSPYNYVNFIK